MYPKFIEVHSITGNYPISISVENIVKIYDDGIDGKSETWGIISVLRGNDICTKETYDELKQLITDAGCLIHKADPRLDTDHALTMDDLKDMIGEPVWNSNNGHWMIVEGFSDNGKLVRFQLVGCTRKFVSEQELIKYPLYRMKVAK